MELDALAPLKRWVAWRGSRKLPYDPATGDLASSTDPTTWGTRVAAEARARELGGGIGLVLGPLLDARRLVLVGVDLDSCRTPSTGAVEPWATRILADVPTYAEVSPSGTGAKLFGLIGLPDMPALLKALGKDGEAQRWGRKWTREPGKHPPAVELYLGGRYFAVTDDWLIEGPWALRQLDPAVLLDLIRTEGGRTARTGDNSRSGDAARLAARMKRAGADLDAYREAVTSDPLTAAWAAEKGERQIARTWERIGAAGDAGDVFDAYSDADTAPLQTSKGGGRLSNLHNALSLLRADPALSGLLGFDGMASCAMLMHPVPRHPAIGNPPAATPRPVEDGDVTALLEYLQASGLTALGSSVLHEAVNRRAAECPYHPVRDYLDGLAWDEVPRLDGWLSTYLSADATPYTAAIGRMFLIAMVARVRRPGCKVDHVPILEGVQGAGKSEACRILGGAWFSDGLPELGSDAVRVAQHLRGKWLIELAELSAMNRAEASTLKAFVTRTVEVFTPKYGRREVTEPRQCVFVGTVNPEGAGGYLKDATGGRRFWPVKVGDTLDLDGLARDRDQLMAEADTAYRAGKPWWPDRAFEREHIAPQQAARQECDPWQDTVNRWLAGQGGLPVTVGEVADSALNLMADRLTVTLQHRIGRCLREAGWVHKRNNKGRWWEPEGPVTLR